jgi:predicted nuclease with RNAse H fold
MREFALLATRLNRLIEEKGYRATEAHSTSTRKALHMWLKDWSAIQENLKAPIPKGDVETRALATREFDAITAALTAKSHLNNQTELIGDDEEGYIIQRESGESSRHE